MRNRVIKVGLSAVLGLAGLSLAACNPPQVFAVNTTAHGHDAKPGDSKCETSPGSGVCTLEAAVDEGNALGKAIITVPPGYYPDNTLTITGVITINPGAASLVFMPQGSITVEAGATLNLDGVGFGNGSYEFNELKIDVRGTLSATRVQTFSWTNPSLHIAPGGVVKLLNSGIAAGTFEEFQGVAVVNEGSLSARFTTFHQIYGGTAITNQGAGTANLGASLVLSEGTGCAGPGFTSAGYNFAPSNCGLLTSTDLVGTLPAGTIMDGLYRYEPTAASVLTDAIPSGALGCGTDVTKDLMGRPRPTDGNGSNGAACDIGDAERPAA